MKVAHIYWLFGALLVGLHCKAPDFSLTHIYELSHSLFSGGCVSAPHRFLCWIWCNSSPFEKKYVGEDEHLLALYTGYYQLYSLHIGYAYLLSQYYLYFSQA